MPEQTSGKTMNVGSGSVHVFVVRRRSGRRLEVEDAFFNTSSAVFLPTVPQGAAESADDRLVNFSNEELWKGLSETEIRFTKAVRTEPFDPEAASDGDDPEQRQTGLYVLIAALRFLEQNPAHKLLVTGHADRSGTDAYNLSLSDARARGDPRARR